MNGSVLVIDDDTTLRRFLNDALSASEFAVAEAADGTTGISMISNWEPDVVLLDVQMPGLDGIATLKGLREVDPHVAVVMVTSVNEVDTVRTALKMGAYDYLVKPLDLPAVLETIGRAIERRNLELQVEQYRDQLELLVYERTNELQKALDQIDGTYTQTILALGSALETRDVETEAHSLRVAGYTTAICRRLEISDPDYLTAIKRGAFLHDIGKIGVPDQILRKPAALSPEEWGVMKQHPLVGVRLLEKIEFLRTAMPIVRNHHERWDGKGYPDGLSGESIPLEARAFAVADTLDAITSDRPYREGRPIIDARRIIAGASGTQLCPKVVNAFAHLDDVEIEQIMAESIHPYRSSLENNQLTKET